MNKLALWLSIAAIALGVVAIVKGYLDGQGFETAGLVGVAVGLVVISVARNKSAARNGSKDGA